MSKKLSKNHKPGLFEVIVPKRRGYHLQMIDLMDLISIDMSILPEWSLLVVLVPSLGARLLDVSRRLQLWAPPGKIIANSTLHQEWLCSIQHPCNCKNHRTTPTRFTVQYNYYLKTKEYLFLRMILRLYIAQHLWVLTVICNAPVACLHRILSQQQLFQTVWPVKNRVWNPCQYAVVRQILASLHPSWSSCLASLEGLKTSVLERPRPSGWSVIRSCERIEHTIPWVTRHTTYGQLYYIPMQALNINTVETPLQSQAMAFCRRVRRVNSGKGSWNRDRAVPQLKHNTKGTRVHCVECRPKWNDPKSNCNKSRIDQSNQRPSSKPVPAKDLKLQTNLS